MEFSRQEYWSELPFPTPEDLPTQGSNPGLQHLLQADSLPLRVLESPCMSLLVIDFIYSSWSFPGGSVVKNLSANAGDAGDSSLIPGLGGSPGEENGNLLQYSCLEKPIDRGDWRATVYGVAKSWTQLSD